MELAPVPVPANRLRGQAWVSELTDLGRDSGDSLAMNRCKLLLIKPCECKDGLIIAMYRNCPSPFISDLHITTWRFLAPTLSTPFMNRCKLLLINPNYAAGG